ncbi:MAG: hypothetical protein ACLURV_03640 [Gallintestinimicrobium sp.]
MSNHSQLTRTKRLLRRLTRKPPIRTLRPNILPAAFEKLSGNFAGHRPTARNAAKTDQLNNRLPIIKNLGSAADTAAIRVGFYELEKLSDTYCRESWRFWNRRDRRSGFTGQIMAIQGMLYPWHKGNIRLEPDFEEKYIEGELHLKGRIRLGTLGICGLRILLNKNVRRLIRILRKKEEA